MSPFIIISLLYLILPSECLFPLPTKELFDMQKEKLLRRVKRAPSITSRYQSRNDILTNEISPCSEGEFFCSISKECIFMTDVCDGRVDCYDRSDETASLCREENEEYPIEKGTLTEKCELGTSKCPDSKECIPNSYLCDGEPDCRDYSDESYDMCILQFLDEAALQTRGAYPWAAQLESFYSGHFCGGSILNSRWAITAAHCIPYAGFKEFSVIVGEFNRTSVSGNERTYSVEDTILHPDYYFDNAYGGAALNDLALIKLTEPIEFNKLIQPIALPEYKQQSSGMARVAGWGSTTVNGRSREVLRELELPIVSDEVCRNYIHDYLVQNHTLCAGELKPGKSTCTGDSGSGLVCENDSGDVYLCGITSWGVDEECGSVEHPSIFSEVSYYVPWIKGIINAK